MGLLSPATPVGPTWPGAELSAPPTELSSHPRSSTAPTGVCLLESHHQLWLAAQRCRENPAVSNASGSELSTKKVLILMKENIFALSKMCTLNISFFFFVSSVNEVAGSEAGGEKSLQGVGSPTLEVLMFTEAQVWGNHLMMRTACFRLYCHHSHAAHRIKILVPDENRDILSFVTQPVTLETAFYFGNETKKHPNFFLQQLTN